MKSRKKKFLLIFLIVGVVLCLSTAILLRFVFLWFVRVPTGSMANTIIPVDHIVATKWCFGELERGEIVVFEHLGRGQAEYHIARVIGLPGESVQVKADGVYINDQRLPEIRVKAIDSEASAPLTIEASEGDGPYQVYYTQEPDEQLILELPYAGAEPLRLDQNSYFVMGDNRDNSEDSRYSGPVKRESIWGRARMVYLSTDPKTHEARPDRTFMKLK